MPKGPKVLQLLAVNVVTKFYMYRQTDRQQLWLTNNDLLDVTHGYSDKTDRLFKITVVTVWQIRRTITNKLVLHIG